MNRLSLLRRPALPWAAALLLILSAPALRASGEALYTCGMHPQIIKTEPGFCPICGMELTPIRDGLGRGGSSAPAIRIDSATVQRMNLKTAVVTVGPVVREFRTVGSVAYDQRGLRDITTKYEGWIERLFVGATGEAVRTGDPLFEIYSPDLYNAELNYLVALGSEGTAGGPVTRAAEARLRLFDLPAEAVTGLAHSGKASRTYVFRAPAAGVVVEKMAVAGQKVMPGERIYRLADLATVWVLAQVFEQDLAFVRPGQAATVRVTYGPERVLTGTVEALLPQVEEQTRSATARIALPNPDMGLRPGMFVDVRFAAQLADRAVLVPDLAVLRSGERNTVFLARADGSFEPREVKLGARSQGNTYQILAGLEGGEHVVTSGQFMLDSESQLRDAIQKMLKAEASPVGAAPAQAPRAKPETPAVGMEEGSALPDSARALLQELALSTVDAAEALAADDLAGYRRALPRMRQGLAAFLGGSEQAARGPLGAFRDGPADRTAIKEARRDFAYFSTAVADLARENGVTRAAGLHTYECPMAPGIGTGRWMSRKGELKNPFYGSTMLDCGEEVDAPQGPAPAPQEPHPVAAPSRRS